MSVTGFWGPEMKQGRTADDRPTSHCWDETSRAGYQEQTELKRVGVLAENVIRIR